MKKLLEIPWDILGDKYTEHKFNIESSISEITG